MTALYVVPKTLFVILLAVGLYTPNVHARVGSDFASEHSESPPMVTRPLDERMRSMQSVDLLDIGLAPCLQRARLVQLKLSFQKLAQIIGRDKKASDFEFPWPLPIDP